MIGLDTNLLVRFATRDDPEQYRITEALLLEAREQGQRCYVNHIVLCELVWTLARCYRFSRRDIAATVEMLITIPEFEIEDREAVGNALASYRAGKADFSDYLIGHVNARQGAAPTGTFDRGVRDSELFRVLG